jgi:phage-related protein
MSATVGEIGLNLVLNRQGFSKSLNAVQEQANSVSNNMKSSLKKLGSAIVAAFSVAAIKQFGQQCIESAAQVNAANSQFEQTFGSMESQAKSAIQSVAKESGILETRLQGVGTSIYAFAKTTGMDSANALNMMQEALQVTADSAAYYDRSLEDTAESLKSFLKGNFENDAALGLSCTETTRNAAANKLYGKSFTELSESQKQLTLLQMVKDANQLSGAMGQASREADGWENVTGNLKESWNQLLAVIGKPILQVATNIVQKLSSAIAKLTEYAKGAINALSKLFNWGGDDTADSISAAASSAENLSSEAESSSESLENVADSSEKAKNSVAGFDKLNVLTKSDSGGSDTSARSTSASNGTSVANTVVKDTNSGVSGAFKNLYEKSGFKGFVQNVQKGINKVDWSSIGKNCKIIFDNVKPIAKKSFEKIQQVSAAKLKAVGSAFGAVATIGGKSFQTLSGGVAKWISKDREKIIGFIDTIGNNLTNGYNNLSTFFDNFGTLAGNAIDNVRPQMEESISNLLSGLTTFAGSVGEVISGAFSIATESLVEWTENDGATITEFLENLQLQFADVFDFIGQIFGDIGTIISEWWNGNGQEIFQNVCDMFLNIGTTLMNVYNQWIKPAWDFIVAIVKSAWENWLKPVFEGAINFFGKVADCVSTVWNNFLSPLVNWLVSFLGPKIQNVFNAVKRVFDNVFTFIGGLVNSILKTFGGLIDFITGVFSGDWKKAWQGIHDFFKGIWDGIGAVFKFIVNAIIDGINSLWTGIYNFVSGVIDAIGGIAGAIGSIIGQDWSFSMPENPPLIPHLATGGLVKAPTLAVVGDNAGANSGNPEVIAPLSKLQGMINTSNGEDTVILGEILSYLKKLYEMFVIFRNNGGNYYQFVAEINGNDIFNEIVKQNELYKNRHNGKSAFE